jgi:hypothetical protein
MFAIVIVGAGLIALGVWAGTRWGEYRRAGSSVRPAPEGSLDRYRPMARLLSGEDAGFLRQQTSCPKVAARWERSRRRIIRLYLKELAADFNGLHAKARSLVAESPEQCAGLVPVLFRLQFTFWRALLLIELQLALGRLNAVKINPEGLVQTMEAMRREISHAAAAGAA